MARFKVGDICIVKRHNRQGVNLGAICEIKKSYQTSSIKEYGYIVYFIPETVHSFEKIEYDHSVMSIDDLNSLGPFLDEKDLVLAEPSAQVLYGRK